MCWGFHKSLNKKPIQGKGLLPGKVSRITALFHLALGGRKILLKILTKEEFDKILTLYTGVYGYAAAPQGITPTYQASAKRLYRCTQDPGVSTCRRRSPLLRNRSRRQRRNSISPLRAFQDASFGGGSDVGSVNGQIGRKMGAVWFAGQRMPYHTKGSATAGTIALDGFCEPVRPRNHKAMRQAGSMLEPFIYALQLGWSVSLRRHVSGTACPHRHLAIVCERRSHPLDAFFYC